MVMSISPLKTPIGSVEQWIRPDNATSLPGGWLICDGSTVVDSGSGFNGKALPDMRGAFARGHNSLTNANFASDTVYYVGGTMPTGGENLNALYHRHTVGTHGHGFSVNTSSKAADTQYQNFGGVTRAAVHYHPVTGTLSASSNYTGYALSDSTENRPAYVGPVMIVRHK